MIARAGVASLIAGGIFAANATSDANSVSSLQSSLGNNPSPYAHAESVADTCPA